MKSKLITSINQSIKINEMRSNGTLERHVNALRKRNHNEKIKAYSTFLNDDFENDPRSIVRLLRFKLERNLKYLKKNKQIANPKIYAQMREVIRLFQVLEKDDFGQKKEFRAHEVKFKRLKELNHASSDPKERKAFLKMWRQSQKSYQNIEAKTRKLRIEILKKAFNLISFEMWAWYDHEYFGDQSQSLRQLEFPVRTKRMNR